MKNLLALGVGLLVLAAARAANEAEADRLTRDLVATLGDLAATLETVRDNASADKAIPQLAKQADRLRGLKQKIDALKLTAEENKKLAAKYKDEVGKALKRLSAASAQAGKNVPDRKAKLAAALGRAKG